MPNEPWNLLAARRHVPLRRLLAPGPDEAALLRIFGAAAHAPDHGVLRPWRFIVVSPERRPALAQVFVEALAERTPGADDDARAMAAGKAFHAPCLVAAVLIDDPDAAQVPRAEKLLSLGCALQNMLLAAQALGFGSGLASGATMDVPGMRHLLRLAAHEQAICFIGFGTPAAGRAPRTRPALADFVSAL